MADESGTTKAMQLLWFILCGQGFTAEQNVLYGFIFISFQLLLHTFYVTYTTVMVLSTAPLTDITPAVLLDQLLQILKMSNLTKAHLKDDVWTGY